VQWPRSEIRTDLSRRGEPRPRTTRKETRDGQGDPDVRAALASHTSDRGPPSLGRAQAVTETRIADQVPRAGRIGFNLLAQQMHVDAEIPGLSSVS